MGVCVHVRACVRASASARACVRACVCACMCVRVCWLVRVRAQVDAVRESVGPLAALAKLGDVDARLVGWLAA